jgi:hypothetical protein
MRGDVRERSRGRRKKPKISDAHENDNVHPTFEKPRGDVRVMQGVGLKVANFGCSSNLRDLDELGVSLLALWLAQLREVKLWCKHCRTGL